MSAKVTFLAQKNDKVKMEEKPIMLVPSSSVVTRKGIEVVFIVNDDKAVEVSVKLGRKFGDSVEIISGIDAGENIIDKVTEKIKDGVEVKVL